MTKVFVVYDSKYGNTKQAAENILAGIKEVEGIETAIGYVKEVNPAALGAYNAIVLGAPNHMGRPSRAMKRFVDSLSIVGLKAEHGAVFGSYAGKERQTDRAMNKLEKTLAHKLPKLKLISPGLSVRVNGITGPIVEGELPKCVELGKKIAEQLKSL